MKADPVASKMRMAATMLCVHVSALVNAAPWPFNIYIHLAAWSGLRAAELAGLQVGDIELPSLPTKPALLRVDRTVINLNGERVYDSPKTKGSRRRVPLTPDTTALLRDYLDSHPHSHVTNAPLFCAVTLKPSKPTGKRATDSDGNRIVPTALDALAALSADEAADC